VVRGFHNPASTPLSWPIIKGMAKTRERHRRYSCCHGCSQLTPLNGKVAADVGDNKRRLQGRAAKRWEGIELVGVMAGNAPGRVAGRSWRSNGRDWQKRAGNKTL